MKRSLRPPTLAALIAAAGLAASVLGWYLLGRALADEGSARFAPGSLEPWLSPVPLFLLVLGVGMSALAGAVLFVLGRAGADALRLAERATGELRGQLSFTQQLIEAIPSPVFFKDRQGRYLGCNRAFEAFIGVPRASLVGKTVEDVATRDFAEVSTRADLELFATAGSSTYETTFTYAKDGSRHEVLVNKATFYGPSGEVAGLVGVLVDITERKQLEAETRESHERLRAVIHASPLAIVARDLEGVIRMWNPAAERLFGWTEAEMLETDTSITPERLRADSRELRRRAESGETLWLEETRRMRRDGREIDVSLSVAPIYGAEGVVIGTMMTLADISRRKIAEQALRESEEQLRLAMDAAQMGIWYWECETDRFLHSEGLGVLFGGRAADPMSHYRVFQQRLHAEDRELLEATMRHAIRRGTDFQIDYRVVWPDGSTHWLTNRGQIHRDANGRAQRVIGVAMDITDRKLAEQRIAHMAHHDALTGLPNRVLLRDRIQQAIAHAHREGTQLAVLFLDLDRFKTINDSLGHQLGDRLLQAVASRILVCVREGDTVARVGGDEFVIVIPGVSSSADASAVGTKILEVLASAFHLAGNDLHVSGSIGISLYPSDGADAETLMRNADTAMYHAKDSGRGKLQFFTQHMNVAAQQRLTLETALRRAVENGEFEVHYQPLFDLRDRSISGFEALLRWKAPDGELILPERFIAAAEESGLIVPIGDWVLREALTQAKAWQSAGRALMLSVNVSAHQLARPSFVERVRRLLAETGIDPGLLELEVTEGVIVEGAGEAREALDQMAALGVGIAIDDFGTGYSGLAYLKRLPIDTVKIDQSFVRDITIDPDDAAIVTAIVAMASSLGVDVVAEGVETEEQLEALRRLACHRAQGYLLARPMNAAAAARLLLGALEPA
jgi:diguanylate cyclase (GGDEF)-like protein/PAS domain S-box-containing protein